jgi:hypothetical protein
MNNERQKLSTKQLKCNLKGRNNLYYEGEPVCSQAKDLRNFYLTFL